MNFVKMHSESAKKILEVLTSKCLKLLKDYVTVHFTQFAGILYFQPEDSVSFFFNTVICLSNQIHLETLEILQA